MDQTNRLLIVVVLAALFTCGMGKRDARIATASQSVAAATMPEAANRLGFDLFRTLTAATQGGNTFISPYSIHTALTMAWAGARGATASEMASVMRLPAADPVAGAQALGAALASADTMARLDVANSLWLKRGLPVRPEFRETVERAFRGTAAELDFRDPAALRTINGWVKQKTSGMIDRILDRIPGNAALYLINAVYFKGRWQRQFDKSLTEDRDFYPPRGAARRLPFMRQDGEFQYLQGDGFQAVRLPYGAGRFAMYVFLPDQQDGLGPLLKTLDADRWAQWLAGFSKRKGQLRMPRFKADFFRDLVPALMKLGMKRAFGGGADFTGMAPAGLCIDEVLHKAVVEVDEEGTEAAAVTSIGVKFTSVRPGPPPFEMVVDHPFLMAIADGETGTVLFLGAINEPK